MKNLNNSKETQTGEFAAEIIADMDKITWDRIGQMSIDNACRNLAVLDSGESIAALRDHQIGEGESALIVAAGPSIKFQDPAKLIKSSGYKGAIICAESSVRYLITNGIIPDLVVTVDPHPTRVVRWLGDPDLTKEKLQTDDYFRRQDMDETFSNELLANEDILKLLEEHGKKLKFAVSTSSGELVVKRVLDIGAKVYWWNPMLDDPDLENSSTKDLQKMNSLPAINAGGNVGSAAFMIADAVLSKKKVGLVGVDFSYYEGTPYKKTQYYDAMLRVAKKDNLDPFFIRIYNHYIDKWFFTDPAYMWYRNVFLEMAQEADCEVYNCTEGGILFDDPIKFISLSRFFESVKN